MTASYHPQHPDISDEMWNKIDQIIDNYRSVSGAIITVLRECQNIVNYLPVVLIDYISKGMNLSRSSVYGIASFYALFSMQPKGRHTIKMCLGTACFVKGIKEVVTRVSNAYSVEEGGTTDDRRFSLESVRCLGACGLAPVMVVNDDVHGAVTSEGIIKILDQYE